MDLACLMQPIGNNDSLPTPSLHPVNHYLSKKQNNKTTTTMKFNLFALVTILSCSTNAVVRASCTESTGVCVCQGACPSFIAGWNTVIDGGSICVATTSTGVSLNNGVVTIDGQFYSSEESCSSAVADGASGDAGASGGVGGGGGGGGGGNSEAGMMYTSAVVVIAAAVVGGVAAL